MKSVTKENQLERRGMAYARKKAEDPVLEKMFNYHPATYVGNITREGTSFALFSQYTHKIPLDTFKGPQKINNPLYFFRAQENSVPFVKVDQSYISTTFVAIEVSKVTDYISMEKVEEREPPHEECVKALQDAPNLYAINIADRQLITLDKYEVYWTPSKPGQSLAEYLNENRKSEIYPKYTFNELENQLKIKPQELKIPEELKVPDSLPGDL